MIFLFLFTTNVFANCSVYIPNKVFHYDGYPIHFDFTALLAPRGYHEVFEMSEAETTLRLQGTQQLKNHFNFANASISIVKPDDSILSAASASQRCWTQLCSANDFAKAFKKTYQELSKKLPNCH